MEPNMHSKLEWDNITGKKRDCSQIEDSFQELAKMDAEAFASRSMKVCQVEEHEERKGKHPVVVGIDDSHWMMQPPRPSSKGPIQLQSLPHHNSKMWGTSRQDFTSGVLGQQLRPSYVGSHAEKAPGISRENTTLLQMPFPPPDEGSRNGLKGSSMASLLKNGSTTPPEKGQVHISQTAGKSKFPCYTATRYQPSSPTSRQLTIFYGGQAHVFDDVPFDKAEAIVALAGSNGRCWSTTYSPQLSGNVTPSARQASHSILDREKESALRKDSAIKGFSGLTHSSSDMHPILANALKSGSSGHVRSFNSVEGNNNYVPRTSEAHVAIENRVSAFAFSSANIDACKGEPG